MHDGQRAHSSFRIDVGRANEEESFIQAVERLRATPPEERVPDVEPVEIEGIPASDRCQSGFLTGCYCGFRGGSICSLLLLDDPLILSPLEKTGIPGEGRGFAPLQFVEIGVERVDQVVLGDGENGTRDGENG